jgi:hypothetical protein
MSYNRITNAIAIVSKININENYRLFENLGANMRDWLEFDYEDFEILKTILIKYDLYNNLIKEIIPKPSPINTSSKNVNKGDTIRFK